MKALNLLFLIGVILITTQGVSQNSVQELEQLPIDKKTNCYIRYHYFPNLQAYFDNLKKVYYYRLNGKWTSSNELPENYGGYSLYNKARVIITDYDGENPEQFIHIHKKKYPYNSKGRFTYATASSK